MKKQNYFIFIFLLLFSNACISQKADISVKEQENINLFNDFINYLISIGNKKEDIGDNAHLKYVLLHYVFVNKPLDSSNQTTVSNTELTPEQVKTLKKELNDFSNFIKKYEKDHFTKNLTLIPIRLRRDTSIYNRLTDFQKENTYVLYDGRFPDTTLSYILFVPPLKKIIDNPRIWSWTLMFKFGKYMFKSLTGEEGYEYIFSSKN